MGRELQKKKNKSSIRKATQKPKSKKKLLRHPIIAANWDQKQTLSQNYARLGLTSRLNKVSGGVEKKVGDVPAYSSDEGGERGTRRERRIDDLKITGRKKETQIEVGEAQIVRDKKTGRILSVLDDGRGRANPLNDPLNALDSDSEPDSSLAASLPSQHNLPRPTTSASLHAEPQTEVVRALEELSQHHGTRYVHKQSARETAFLRELIDKYGEDYVRMARDIKVNYMQRSEGDLKRRIKIMRSNMDAAKG